MIYFIILYIYITIVDFGTNSRLKKIVPTHSTEHNHLKIASGEVTRWS